MVWLELHFVNKHTKFG